MPVKVIAHERTQEMSGYTENFKERAQQSSAGRDPGNVSNNIVIILPHLTFTQRAELLYGGRRIGLITSAATPRRRVSSGCKKEDPLRGRHRVVDQHHTWRRATRKNGCALELIRLIGADYLIPGHGPAGVESTYRAGEYIEFARRRVRRLIIWPARTRTTERTCGRDAGVVPCAAGTQSQDRAKSAQSGLPAKPARRRGCLPKVARRRRLTMARRRLEFDGTHRRGHASPPASELLELDDKAERQLPSLDTATVAGFLSNLDRMDVPFDQLAADNVDVRSGGEDGG